MAHYNQYRDSKVKVRRAIRITRRASASGGPIYSEAQDKKLKRKRSAPRLQVTGGAVKARLDRRARGGMIRDYDPKRDGDQNELEHEATPEKRAEHSMRRARSGRTKKPDTTVNVMVAPQHPAMCGPVPVPVGGLGGPPIGAMPPRPPVPSQGAPMMAPPMMAAPGTPPPIRRDGGRVKDGPPWSEGLRNMTPIRHSPGKNDTANIGRGRPITYKRGGAVESSDMVEAASKLPGGSRGALARLAKETT